MKVSIFETSTPWHLQDILSLSKHAQKGPYRIVDFWWIVWIT